MIYFIGTKTGYVKIGFTDQKPEKRLSGLQTGSAEKLYLIAWMPGDKECEAALHERYRKHWSHGEWFRLEGDLRAFVRTLYRSLFQNPGRLSPAAREHRDITFTLGTNDVVVGRKRKLANVRSSIQDAKKLDSLSACRKLSPPGRD